MVKRKYYPNKEGKQVYPWYNLNKNISWHNVYVYPMGILYGLFTFEWIREPKSFIKRLKPIKFWLPPVYAKGYYEEIG